MEPAGLAVKVDRRRQVRARIRDVLRVAGGRRGRPKQHRLERADVAARRRTGGAALVGGRAAGRVRVTDRRASVEQRLRARRTAVVPDRGEVASTSEKSRALGQVARAVLVDVVAEVVRDRGRRGVAGSSPLAGATQAKSTPSEKPAPMIVLATVVVLPLSVSIAPRRLPERVSLLSVRFAPALSIPPPKSRRQPLLTMVVLTRVTVPPGR